MSEVEYRKSAEFRESERQRGIRYREGNREKVRASTKKWWANPTNRDKRRDAKYHLRYGITWQEREALLVTQGNCCAACRATEPGSKSGWHTDHNPLLQKGDPDYIRGIVCHHCNVALGPKATPNRLRKLAIYLEKHNGPTVRTI